MNREAIHAAIATECGQWANQLQRQANREDDDWLADEMRAASKVMRRLANAHIAKAYMARKEREVED